MYLNITDCSLLLLPKLLKLFEHLVLSRWFRWRLWWTLSWIIRENVTGTTLWCHWILFLWVFYLRTWHIYFLNRRTISHFFIGVAVIAAVDILAERVLTLESEATMLCDWSIVCLVEPFEYYICVQISNVLPVDFLHQLAWLWLDNADIVNPAAADLDDFSVHQRLHKLWWELHTIDFVVFGVVEGRWSVETASCWLRWILLFFVLDKIVFLLWVSPTHERILLAIKILHFGQDNVLEAVPSFSFILA